MDRLNAAAGNRFFNANCIASPSFSVLGRSYTMDTATFCSFASVMGYIFVALASVAAVKIIGT